MRAPGKMTKEMALAKILGLMVINMSVNIKTTKETVKGHLFGPMAKSILVFGKMTKGMEKASTLTLKAKQKINYGNKEI